MKSAWSSPTCRLLQAGYLLDLHFDPLICREYVHLKHRWTFLKYRVLLTRRQNSSCPPLWKLKSNTLIFAFHFNTVYRNWKTLICTKNGHPYRNSGYQNKKPTQREFCVLQEMATYSTGSAGEFPGGQLTMGIIGCLPDNVQQVICMHFQFLWLHKVAFLNLVQRHFESKCVFYKLYPLKHCDIDTCRLL
jgi:hypothetical protein